MNDVKPWYASRTIWASLITVIGAVGSLTGLPLAGLNDPALTDTVVQAITGVAGVIAIFGRVAATTRIAS